MLKKPIVNTMWQVGGKVMVLGISLVTTGILTRRLGNQAYGGLVLISSVFILLDSLADFGTKIIGVRELVRSEKFFGSVVAVRLLMTGVAFVVGLGLIFGWEGLGRMRLEAVMALMMIWLTSVGGSMEIGWQKEMEMGKKVIMDVTFPLLFLMGIWWWKGRLGLTEVFEGYLIARVISLGVGYWFTEVKYRQGWGKINLEKIKYLLKESWPMGVYLLVFAAYDRAVDSMMIERFRGIAEVGWYGLGYKVYSNLVQPAYFLVVSVFPLLSKGTGNTRKLFWKTMGLLVAGAVVIAGVVAVAAPWMIELLGGRDFAPAVGVLRVLMVALMFAYIQHLIGFTLISRGEQRILLLIGLVALVFNVGVNWWAIPRFGILGAAVVTGLTEMLATVLMGWRLWAKY